MLLTIIIPCINGRDYVKRVMQSVGSQLTKECEIILVDDGTTDGTGALCETYAAENVSVLHGKYGDQAASRNAGVAKARGEYVWFIDFDDYIAPNAIETVTKALKDCKPDILRFTHADDENGVITEIAPPFLPGVYTGEQLFAIQRYAVERVYTASFYIWLQIYRTELLRQTPVLPPKQYLSESNSLVQRIYPRAKKLCVLGETLYFFVQHPDSSGHVNLFPPAYPALNLYRVVRDDLKSIGVYDQYRDAFVNCIMNTVILRLFNKQSGAFVMEYTRCKSVDIAHEHIRDILASPDFKELVADAKKTYKHPLLQMCYQLMEQEDEEKLYKLLMAF